MLTQYADFSVRWNHRPSILPGARRGEWRAVSLVLAGAGSGKTSVLVARAGWLLTTGEAVADQILLLAFGRKAAQEMDERIQARLHTRYLGAHVPLPRFTHHSTGQQKVPVVSKLENDAQARRALFIKAWRQQCSEKGAGERLASVA